MAHAMRRKTAALRASAAQLTVIVGPSALPLASGLTKEITMRKAKYRRVVVITPSGNRRVMSVPVAGFKSTKAVLARHGFRVVSR